jgi:hypothetical protein
VDLGFAALDELLGVAHLVGLFVTRAKEVGDFDGAFDGFHICPALLLDYLADVGSAFDFWNAREAHDDVGEDWQAVGFNALPEMLG